MNFSQAFELILELGGIPCYPTLADGANPICPYEEPVEKLIDNLKQNNIHCAELIPIRNQPDVLACYAIAMRQAGIVLVCGTEHNTPDLIPIQPTCIGGKKIPDEIMDIFIEGACVVAAHQYLAFCGQCGFTDSEGMPNSAWTTAEQRIGAFADLGFTVIQKYKEIPQQ